ncbi:MAG: hypothetical protein QM638_19960 [Nocardioides sp.]|uniref:hypothetical protein n=1 Tax=Nocardioides sp. TaxID=35761 RepID=UPI0039E2C129
MGIRGASLATGIGLLVIALGAVTGWVIAQQSRPAAETVRNPVTFTSPNPMPAAPALPIAKARAYADDISYPELATDLRYVTRTAKTGTPTVRHVWSYQVPAGWKRYQGTGTDPAGTLRWRPRDEPVLHGYALRVLPITDRVTITTLRDSQTETMRQLTDFQLIRETSDSAWYSFRSEDNYHRLNYFAWVRIPDSPYAGFELSVSGRVEDRNGLADLLKRVQESVRMVR